MNFENNHLVGSSIGIDDIARRIAFGHVLRNESVWNAEMI